MPSSRASFLRGLIFGVALAMVGAGAVWLVKRGDGDRRQHERARAVTEARGQTVEETSAPDQQERGRLAREMELQDQLEKEKAEREAAETRAEEERRASAARAMPPATLGPAPAAIAIPSVIRSQPFVNSLGMRFMPVPGVRGVFCVWKTRVSDYLAYSEGKPYPENAKWRDPGFPQSPSDPVVNVSWYEAQQFCEWLTLAERKAARIASNEMYRLPTDAEWSAAVGTTEYPWGYGFPPPRNAGNYGIVDDGYKFTSPVGSFKANAYGLYDLGGNAWEWCEDEYRSDMNDEEAKKVVPSLRNERASDATPFGVLRGASWRSGDPIVLRSAYRVSVRPAVRDDDVGFRVVLVSDSR